MKKESLYDKIAHRGTQAHAAPFRIVWISTNRATLIFRKFCKKRKKKTVLTYWIFHHNWISFEIIFIEFSQVIKVSTAVFRKSSEQVLPLWAYSFPLPLCLKTLFQPTQIPYKIEQIKSLRKWRFSSWNISS